MLRERWHLCAHACAQHSHAACCAAVQPGRPAPGLPGRPLSKAQVRSTRRPRRWRHAGRRGRGERQRERAHGTATYCCCCLLLVVVAPACWRPHHLRAVHDSVDGALVARRRGRWHPVHIGAHVVGHCVGRMVMGERGWVRSGGGSLLWRQQLAVRAVRGAHARADARRAVASSSRQAPAAPAAERPGSMLGSAGRVLIELWTAEGPVVRRVMLVSRIGIRAARQGHLFTSKHSTWASGGQTR